MKKLLSLSIISIMSCLSAFAISEDLPIEEEPSSDIYEDLQVINICNLTNEDLNEIMQGHHPQLAIEFSEGTLLPIHFFLKGDLISLVESDGAFGQIQIAQTFYVRCIEGELIFSINQVDWKSFAESITGSASIVVMVQDGEPCIVFGAEANHR